MHIPNKTILFDINQILDKMNIEEGQSVADFGCGNFGYFVFPLAKSVGKKGKVFAVDILKDALKEVGNQASSHNLNQIQTVWTDLEIFNATKIQTESLDSAIMINVINQADNRLNMLKEVTRLLKSNGKLAIVEWKKEDIPLGPETEKRLSADYLEQMCSRVGLKIKEKFEAGKYHNGLILTKL